MSTPDSRRASRTPVSQRAQAPARNLSDLTKLCDPYTPLLPDEDKSLHEDLTSIRGGDRLAKIVRNIRRSGGVPTLHFLTGHLGSGKTTELLATRRRLQQREGTDNPLHVLFVDADAMLDPADVELEDILVAVWRVVAEQAPLAADKTLAPIWRDRIKSTFQSAAFNLPATLALALPEILSFLRRAPTEERRKLRGAIGSVSNAFVEGLNLSFEALRNKESGTADSMEVAVLIDNLEKLNPVDRTPVERLYLERMVALKELDAHLVITVPLYLAYSKAGAGLIGLYGGEVVMLPMIKVRKPQAQGGGDYEYGIDLLVELLEKRVDFERLFEDKREAAREIARRSGGCIRHALRLVVGAANECDAPPVTRAAVDRATAILQADFDRALPEKWVPILKQIQARNCFPADIGEDDKREMLRHLIVLEYQNGDPEAWVAVHPLVERCRKFQQGA